MTVFYAILLVACVLIGLALLLFFWAIKSGQYDDLDSPAYRILFDDDKDHQP